MGERKLITIDEAIELLNERHQFDAKKHGRDIYSKKTIYNKIHKGELKRYGPRHLAQLDEAEVILKLCR